MSGEGLNGGQSTGDGFTDGVRRGHGAADGASMTRFGTPVSILRSALLVLESGIVSANALTGDEMQQLQALLGKAAEAHERAITEHLSEHGGS
jgi:hypothetical protein